MNAQLRMDQTLPGAWQYLNASGKPCTGQTPSMFRSDGGKFSLVVNADGTLAVHPLATGTGLYFVLTSQNGVQVTSPTFDIVPADNTPASGTITFGTPTPA